VEVVESPVHGLDHVHASIIALNVQRGREADSGNRLVNEVFLFTAREMSISLQEAGRDGREGKGEVTARGVEMDSFVHSGGQATGTSSSS
jgi:hypothetical protein